MKDPHHHLPQSVVKANQTASSLVARLFLLIIRLYQRILSPILGPSCRFHPSCSNYACTCLSTHGPWRGSWLAIKRIARCNPWHPGGVDFPPDAPESPQHISTD